MKTGGQRDESTHETTSAMATEKTHETTDNDIDNINDDTQPAAKLDKQQR